MGGFTSVPIIESFPIGDIIDTTPGYVTITTNGAYVVFTNTETGDKIGVSDTVPIYGNYFGPLTIKSYNPGNISVINTVSIERIEPNKDGEYTFTPGETYIVNVSM